MVKPPNEWVTLVRADYDQQVRELVRLRMVAHRAHQLLSTMESSRHDPDQYVPALVALEEALKTARASGD